MNCRRAGTVGYISDSESQSLFERCAVGEHAVIQMDERGLTVDDIRSDLDNGEDIETRPDERPYPARLVLGMTKVGPFTSLFVTTSS